MFRVCNFMGVGPLLGCDRHRRGFGGRQEEMCSGLFGGFGDWLGIWGDFNAKSRRSRRVAELGLMKRVMLILVAYLRKYKVKGRL